jgi:diacylglycerol O-acyltransferase / wax synthase
MSKRSLQFEPRMSDQEALMWALELDPVLRSSFSSVTFFDVPPDVGRLRDRLARACHVVPRLRQRLEEPAAGFAPPAWVDDPLFDLDFHIRHIAVPAPGTDRQVLDLAALLSSDAFDRSRPLWQFVIIEGLEGGRGAMVHRFHHALADGEASIRLSGTFIDIERDAAEPLVKADSTEFQGLAEPQRSTYTAVRDSVTGAMRKPLDVARWTVHQVVTDPREAPSRATDAVETARSLLRQIAVTEPARSPLWTERSLRRRVEVLSLPFAEVKEAAAALGGTINDFFVTGAVGAAGAYHRAKGVDVVDLRMAMPVSTRSETDTGGNAFAPTRMLVPAGIVDPLERFAAVRDIVQTTKKERAMSVTGQLAGLINVLPTPLIAKAARQQVGTVDFTTSNVRGAKFDLFIAGARIEGNYPMGPLAGTAFNLTTLSSSGRLDMGCVIDTAAVAEPELLLSCLEDAYDELLAAGR